MIDFPRHIAFYLDNQAVDTQSDNNNRKDCTDYKISNQEYTYASREILL